MRDRQKGVSASALGLVVLSLLLAATACYSGQIPGVFELTPFYTPTPLARASDPQFKVLDVVLAPQEPGRTFFNLTSDPEPLLNNLVNSKTMCQGDSAALILYAGDTEEGETYYLVECGGSVGWVLEDRLAGPLNFTANQLAITVASPGQQAVPVLDERTFQPMPFNPLQRCLPETVVSIIRVQATDADNDGEKTVFYLVECPTTAGPLRGWLTNDELFGPIEIDVDDRALAIEHDDTDRDFVLASEPAPVTDDNAVSSEECSEGSVLVAQEARLVDGNVFYLVSCGDLTGWTQEDRFVGPLLYDIGDLAVLHVEPVFVFEDELAALMAAAPEVSEEETGEPVDEPVEAEAVEPEIDEEAVVEAEEMVGMEDRRVVRYTPPIYLTSNPAPAVPTGEGANVVTECPTNEIVELERYSAVDSIYYRVTCDVCVETETDEDENVICVAEEARTGWVEQRYLVGPLHFASGERVTFTSNSRAVEADEESGVEYARIPLRTSGAESIGRFTEFAGRCPLDQPVTITGVILEQARTSSAYTFYYAIACEGQVATTVQVSEDGVIRPEVAYEGEDVLISGYALARDLARIDE